jgi:ABC-2 type transport system ATP-binding protein
LTNEQPFAIEARGLTKTYGSADAVRNLHLQVPSGTLFGFLGPNGSGKSTTVKLLCGLLEPTAGEVRVAGQAVSVENVALRRLVGILPEDDALFHSLTIWEHLEMSGPLYGLSHDETRVRAVELLRHLDLEDKSGTYIDEASFGMRKNGALAMALSCTTHGCCFSTNRSKASIPDRPANIKDLLLTSPETASRSS